MLAALAMIGAVGLGAGVVDVDPAEFARATFAFDAHGHGVTAAGARINVLVDDGTATPPRYSLLRELRVVSAEPYVDGRILMTRVRVEVTPREARLLGMARGKGKILIMHPPGSGIDPSGFNGRP